MGNPAISTRRILVVDDEPLVAEAIRMMLEFDGHRIQIATSGEAALAVLKTDSFDLVITDFAMRGMKGDVLAAAIKACLPRQPIVMITAYAEMLQTSGHPLPGVDVLIGKPFLLNNLREALAKVLPENSAFQTS